MYYSIFTAASLIALLASSPLTATALTEVSSRKKSDNNSYITTSKNNLLAPTSSTTTVTKKTKMYLRRPAIDSVDAPPDFDVLADVGKDVGNDDSRNSDGAIYSSGAVNVKWYDPSDPEHRKPIIRPSRPENPYDYQPYGYGPYYYPYPPSAAANNEDGLIYTTTGAENVGKKEDSSSVMNTDAAMKISAGEAASSGISVNWDMIPLPDSDDDDIIIFDYRPQVNIDDRLPYWDNPYRYDGPYGYGPNSYPNPPTGNGLFSTHKRN